MVRGRVGGILCVRHVQISCGSRVDLLGCSLSVVMKHEQWSAILEA